MKRIILLLIALALLACKKNIVPKPDHFLNDKEMEQLMYDLALLEAFKNAEPRLLDSLQINSKDFIYKKYGIDSLAMAQNMVYYASLPKEYDTIIKKVERRLKFQRDSINNPNGLKNNQNKK